MGSGRSCGSTPPTSRARTPPVCTAASRSLSPRPAPLGSGSTPQAVATSTRASAWATGRPPGSSDGSAPASTAPRSPARRGTHASRAPVASARLATAVSAPGEVASRSPTRITAPSACTALAASATSLSRDRMASSTAASAPGAVATRRPDSFSSPRVANGATACTSRPLVRTRLAESQEQDRRLLLRLEADQENRRGLLEVGVGDADAAAGDLGGQERLLLGRVRAGPEVDVVGAQHRARELRVGVGVLQRGAGRRRGRRPLRAPGPARRRRRSSASAHDVGTSSPSSSRTSGVVRRSWAVA